MKIIQKVNISDLALSMKNAKAEEITKIKSCLSER
jgi:hypothetical protein